MERHEYIDAYVFRRECMKRAKENKIFEVEIDEGITAAFVLPNRKQGTIHLGEMIFDKKFFSYDDACDFWSDFDVRCVRKKDSMNKKVPSLEFAIEVEGDLIVYGFYRNISEYEPKEFLWKQLEEMEVDD